MYGTKYISAIEAAERWHLSRRRVVALCGGGRIIGAQKAGAYWSFRKTQRSRRTHVLKPVNISESTRRKRNQTETEKLSYTDP